MALHMTYARPEDNTQESIALNPPSVLCKETIDIPLTIGAEGHSDVYGPFMFIERFYMCVQERYANISPEKLRWKLKFCRRIIVSMFNRNCDGQPPYEEERS